MLCYTGLVISYTTGCDDKLGATKYPCHCVVETTGISLMQGQVLHTMQMLSLPQTAIGATHDVRTSMPCVHNN